MIKNNLLKKILLTTAATMLSVSFASSAMAVSNNMHSKIIIMRGYDLF